MSETKTKVRVAGLQYIKPVRVDLTKYFGGRETFVEVKPLSTLARAQLQEMLTESVRYATEQKKRDLDIVAINQNMPVETSMRVRALKLTDALSNHNITDEEGKALAWNEELWDALDDANPNILADVMDAISDVSYPDDEKGKNPS